MLALVSIVFAFVPSVAFAQVAAAPAAEGAPWVVALPALVAAVAAFLAAVIPADVMPAWLRAVIDLAAGNWGHAANRDK